MVQLMLTLYHIFLYQFYNNTDSKASKIRQTTKYILLLLVKHKPDIDIINYHQYY